MSDWIQIGMYYAMLPDEQTSEFYALNSKLLSAIQEFRERLNVIYWTASCKQAEETWLKSDPIVSSMVSKLDAWRKELDAKQFYNHPLHRPGMLVEYTHPTGPGSYVFGGDLTDKRPDGEAWPPPDAFIVRCKDLLEGV